MHIATSDYKTSLRVPEVICVRRMVVRIVDENHDVATRSDFLLVKFNHSGLTKGTGSLYPRWNVQSNMFVTRLNDTINLNSRKIVPTLSAK